MAAVASAVFWVYPAIGLVVDVLLWIIHLVETLDCVLNNGLVLCHGKCLEVVKCVCVCVCVCECVDCLGDKISRGKLVFNFIWKLNRGQKEGGILYRGGRGYYLLFQFVNKIEIYISIIHSYRRSNQHTQHISV